MKTSSSIGSVVQCSIFKLVRLWVDWLYILIYSGYGLIESICLHTSHLFILEWHLTIHSINNFPL